MNIKRAKEEIKNAVEAYLWKDEFGNYEIPAVRQRPILLMGPPGVGKTQIMEQVAKECGIGLVAYTITHHTRQSAVGLPMIERRTYGGKDYAVTEYTMSEIVGAVYDKMASTGLTEGILFIDEINCVSETLAPAMLQFLQCKTFGTHRIPEGWLIAAAGNPPEYNKSVREFDIVTLDRIRRIDVEPDAAVWKEYAVQENVHPAIIAYLDIKKQNFCRIETTVDGPRFVTPRSWEDLSRLVCVYEKMNKPIDRDVVLQYLQYPNIAKDFANYLALYYKYQEDYQVDEILDGRVREGVYDKLAGAAFDERLSMVGLLFSRLNGRFSEIGMQEAVMQRLMEILRRFQEPGECRTSNGQETGGIRMDVKADMNVGVDIDAAGDLADDMADNAADSAVNNSAVKRLSELIQETEKDWEMLKKQELLTRKEDVIYRKVLEKLEHYRRCFYDWKGQKENICAWDFLREQFGADSDRFEEQCEQAGRMLEYAFDFMEAAFGDSQEMVMFITELNSHVFCAAFLQEYDCARYYEYNQRLLFDEREREFLRKD